MTIDYWWRKIPNSIESNLFISVCRYVVQLKVRFVGVFISLQLIIKILLIKCKKISQVSKLPLFLIFMVHKFSSGPFYLFQLIEEASALNKQKSKMPSLFASQKSYFLFIAILSSDWSWIYEYLEMQHNTRERVKLFMGKIHKFYRRRNIFSVNVTVDLISLLFAILLMWVGFRIIQ